MKWIGVAVLLLILAGAAVAQTYSTTGGSGTGITPYQKSVISMAGPGIST